ncbi:MAG: ABC transporter ATP-binding protein [bacterium]
MNPIVIKNLVKKFGPVTAISDLSLEIEAHEIFALLGPDGSGKTTTSRILAAVMDPTGGEAKVASFDVRRESEKIKEKIGYMPQAFGLYPDLSIEENIDFYADIYGISRRDRLPRMNRLLDFTGLAPFVKRLAGRLSGGMKQKLALTCALIHTPEILILDEPTLGVDPVSRREFWKLLYELLKDGATILVTTSYMDEAQRCNRAGLLHRGRLIACDKPDSIRSQVRDLTNNTVTPSLEDAFIFLIKRSEDSDGRV